MCRKEMVQRAQGRGNGDSGWEIGGQNRGGRTNTEATLLLPRAKCRCKVQTRYHWDGLPHSGSRYMTITTSPVQGGASRAHDHRGECDQVKETERREHRHVTNAADDFSGRESGNDSTD